MGARLCDFCPTKLCVNSCFSTRARSGVTCVESLHGNAQAAIVERADPARRARDVGESLVGIEDHADLLGRRVVELRFEVVEVVFEHAQDAAREIGSGAAVIFEVEVRGFAFAIALFLGLVALGFFSACSTSGSGRRLLARVSTLRWPDPSYSRRSRPSPSALRRRRNRARLRRARSSGSSAAVNWLSRR